MNTGGGGSRTRTRKHRDDLGAAGLKLSHHAVVVAVVASHLGRAGHRVWEASEAGSRARQEEWQASEA